MYFNVTIKVNTDVGNGKIKKLTERYLVDANTVTEAEVRTIELLQAEGLKDFDVTSATKSRFAGIILEHGAYQSTM